jgi:hypothetical protein
MGRKAQKPFLPENWPTDPPVTYLTAPSLSKHLTPAQQLFLCSPPPPSGSIESTSHALPVEILTISSPSHPAYTQRGLFASRPLPPGSFLLFYLGLVHNSSPPDNNPSSSYDLSLDRDADLAIDATHMGNGARFVNDYRGVPGREDKGPNCEFRDCWVKTARPNGWERRVGVYVLPAGRAGKRKDGVGKGEEVLVSYGKGFWCRGAGGEEQINEGNDMAKT